MWWSHDPAIDAPQELVVAYREPWQSLQERLIELTNMIREEQKDHNCILIVGHAVLFYALTGKWLANCEITELNINNIRKPCKCSGFACYC